MMIHCKNFQPFAREIFLPWLAQRYTPPRWKAGRSVTLCPDHGGHWLSECHVARPRRWGTSRNGSRIQALWDGWKSDGKIDQVEWRFTSLGLKVHSPTWREYLFPMLQNGGDYDDSKLSILSKFTSILSSVQTASMKKNKKRPDFPYNLRPHTRTPQKSTAHSNWTLIFVEFFSMLSFSKKYGSSMLSLWENKAPGEGLWLFWRWLWAFWRVCNGNRCRVGFVVVPKLLCHELIRIDLKIFFTNATAPSARATATFICHHATRVEELMKKVSTTWLSWWFCFLGVLDLFC